MNNLFTYKGRVILFLLLVFQFGLKLHASAHTRMVCDTDTTAARKGKKTQVVQTDTTLVLKAGSTIFRNADTILIINGVPVKKSINSPDVKKEPATGFVPDAPKLIDAGNTTTIAAPPTDGTIQVKNLSGPPINTTIVAPPTDGTIQVRDTSTPTNGGNQGNNPSGSGKPDTTAGGNHGKGGNPAGTNQDNNANPAATDKANTSGDTNPAANSKADTTGSANKEKSTSPAADSKTDATGDTNPDKNANTAATTKSDTTGGKKADGLPTEGVIQVRNTDANGAAKTDSALNKKADSTLVKKTDSTLMKKSDTTAMQTDTLDETQIQAKNVFLQVGGAGLAISVNYDTRFGKTRDGWGYTVGLGGFVSGGNSVFTVPFQVNFLIGEHSSMLEVGAGTTFLRSTGDSKGTTWAFDRITGFIATGSIGYRYQPEHKGINFRLAFTPLLTDEGLIPVGGVSIGYTFK